MLTPVFWITQDDDSLLVRIRAPHGNLSELDYDHGEFMFVFTCSPYFLRLHFKQMVEEYGNGNGKVEWKSDEGEFHIRIPKMHKKENFTNLDLISDLLNSEKTSDPHGRQMVEEISDEEGEEGEGEEFLHEQEIPVEEVTPEDVKIQEFGYGFGWSRIGVVERLRGEIGRLVDLQNPEEVPIEKRNEMLKEADWEQFDIGRYLADTLEPEDELLSIISSDFSASLTLTDDDRVKLKDLRKSKIPKIWGSDVEIGRSLVDILFSWCYDQRVNNWESTCESGWTCSKLSPSMSFFVKFPSVRECILTAIRRSLSYPLYRSFQLSTRIIDDVTFCFSSGCTALLHILCDIHRIFIESGEFRYILNDLFITDYIFWIQSVSEEVLEGIQKELGEIGGIRKEDLGWDLEMLETEAKMEQTTLDSDDDE
uniref:Protein SHQ1 homolog n=1 Tax=Caenorhabditis tropicalis TaxID=1561998 RepID=A0A1I7TQE2_9PELO